MSYVLALDQGTTGSTALVIDESGRVVGRGYREITQYYPKPGWVEHDPAELLEKTVVAGREAIAAAGVEPAAIGALGITNQRETVVAWDPASPTTAPKAIVWQDRRTTAAVTALGMHQGVIRRATGLTLDPYFSGTKMAWLLDALDHRKVHIGTVDTWLLWNLTGGRVYATEPTNASRTMLFDIDRREWSTEMCAVARRSARMVGRGTAIIWNIRHDGVVVLRGADPDRRNRRRPASRPLWPRLLYAGHREDHVRYRRVSPRQQWYHAAQR